MNKIAVCVQKIRDLGDVNIFVIETDATVGELRAMRRKDAELLHALLEDDNADLSEELDDVYIMFHDASEAFKIAPGLQARFDKLFIKRRLTT